MDEIPLDNVILDWKESRERGRGGECKYRCGNGFLLTNSISILSRVSSSRVFVYRYFPWKDKGFHEAARVVRPVRANFRFLWRVLLERKRVWFAVLWLKNLSRLPETNLVGQHDINSRLFKDRCVTIVWKLELENKAEGVALLHGRMDFERISREMVTKMVSVCGGGGVQKSDSSNFYPNVRGISSCWIIVYRRIVETYEIL